MTEFANSARSMKVTKLNRAGNRRGMSEGSRKTQFKKKSTSKSTAKSAPRPSGPLNKAGNRRGMSAGSRKTQFTKKSVIANTPTAKRTPQQRVQAARIKKSDKAPPVGKKGSIQDMIDDVMSVEGESIKKSLMGMAQRLNAPASDIARIASADVADLERAYNDNGLVFESYWEYPIYSGETRGDTLDEILAMVGV